MQDESIDWRGDGYDTLRAQVRRGELLPMAEFLRRSPLAERQLNRMEKTGHVFCFEFDGCKFFPAIFCDPTLDQRRLRSVCHILVPMPALSRLLYLSSRQGNLGDITPLDALADKDSYTLVRSMARGEASEYARTTVEIYLDAPLAEGVGTKPVYVAVVEVDPRTRLWKRAREAMQCGGYIHPDGPYPRATRATVTVAGEIFGEREKRYHARLVVRVRRSVAHVSVKKPDGAEFARTVPVRSEDDIVEIVRTVILTLDRCDRAARHRKSTD